MNGEATDTINISESNITFVNLGIDTTLCFGESLILYAGSGFDEYLWQNGSTEMQFTVTEPGTYYVTVQNNCGTGSDTITVGYFPEISLNLGNDTILCGMESIMLSTGSVFMDYIWQDGSTAPFYLAQDAGIYWVEVTDGNSCNAEDEIFIDLLVLSVNLGSDTVLCPGTEITLSPDQSFDGYIWLDSLSFEPDFIIDTSGIFWVTCFDSVNQKICFETDTILITQLSNPYPPEIPDEYTMCPGEELTIDAGIGKDFNYLWNDSLNDSVLFVQDSGLFIISISNVCGTIFDSTSVFFYPFPYVEIIVDTISQNEFFLFLNLEFESYYWSNETTNSTMLVNIPGMYWIEVANEFDCKATDSILIEPTECDIFIPNLLTPNHDSSNDYFFIEGMNIQDAHILIFNRWGETVFQSDDKNFVWDGTKNGHHCSEGTYYYIISYNCNNFTNNLQQIKRKGTITLLR
ncbi:MAG: gliding motility-associated C-terminal domain-containing protein [Bacteroidales bacterium]